MEGTQNAICDALFVGTIFAVLGSTLILTNPEWVLSAVLNGEYRFESFILFHKSGLGS